MFMGMIFFFFFENILKFVYLCLKIRQFCYVNVAFLIFCYKNFVNVGNLYYLCLRFVF